MKFTKKDFNSIMQNQDKKLETLIQAGCCCGGGTETTNSPEKKVK